MDLGLLKHLTLCALGYQLPSKTLSLFFCQALPPPLFSGDSTYILVFRKPRLKIEFFSEPVKPVQMNLCQSNTYRKDLS